MNNYIDLPEEGGSSGVSSLNSLTGALSLVAGSGIMITSSGGNTITVSNTEAGGSVTSVSVATANGFAGTVATPTTTPVITIDTTVTGILYGNGTSVAAAIAANFPTLNQNTTGTASNITATSNSTLTTLSALLLPTSQLSGAISLTTQVSGVLPIANGGTGSSTQNFVDLTTAQSVAGVKSFSSQMLISDGTAAAPGLAFVSETNSGLYRVGTSEIGLSVAGTEGMDARNIGASLVNFGFGAAAMVSSSQPVLYSRTLNNAVFFEYLNPSLGTSMSTVLQIAGGTSSNYLTLENYANNTTNTYLGQGSAIMSSPNQTQLVIGSEGSGTFTAFTVGGRTLATERARLTATALTLNKGTNLVLSGATSGALTLNAGTTGTYSLNFPTANAAGAFQNDGSGNVSFGILPPSFGGAPPTTRTLYVDGGRTDTYTADGSEARPFKTIGASITQIITNADNSTHAYTVLVFPFGYSETLSFNSSTLYNLTFAAISGGAAVGQNTTVTGLTSTSNNTQLATLVFNGIAFNGNVNLTGDVTGTNFASSQVLFNNCQFNNSGGTIVLNNINNVNFYNCQIQGSSSVSTFTNVAFGYLEGPEGFIGGTTLHLVDNPGGNVPSQYSGNYFLMSETKNYATVTIDAGSELDSLLSYFGPGSAVTNNGTIHSWQTGWNGTLTANNGSTTRVQGDVFLNAPTINAGATFTNIGLVNALSATLGDTAVAATNATVVFKNGHLKSTQTTAPTTTTNANAGTGASSSVAHATDSAGVLNLTLGSVGTTASGAQVTVNFNKAYNVAPVVTLFPTNAVTAQNSAAFGVYVTSTTSGFTVNFAVAGTATDVLQWNYQAIETQ